MKAKLAKMAGTNAVIGQIYDLFVQATLHISRSFISPFPIRLEDQNSKMYGEYHYGHVCTFDGKGRKPTQGIKKCRCCIHTIINKDNHGINHQNKSFKKVANYQKCDEIMSEDFSSLIHFRKEEHSEATGNKGHGRRSYSYYS